MRSPRCRPVLVVLGFALGLPVASAQRAELEGTWLQLSQAVGPIRLTPEGQAALVDYVPLRDDPDLRCEPASLTNVISIPDPPWALRLLDDHVEFHFEYMDVKRRVRLGPDLTVGNAPHTVADHPHMGRSVGRFEGDALVIETGDITGPFVNTLFRAEGHPQSNEMRYEERYRAEGDRLYLEITHTDPINYLAPLVMSFEFLRVDLEVLEFDCQMDGANYDDRL